MYVSCTCRSTSRQFDGVLLLCLTLWCVGFVHGIVSSVIVCKPLWVWAVMSRSSLYFVEYCYMPIRLIDAVITFLIARWPLSRLHQISRLFPFFPEHFAVLTFPARWSPCTCLDTVFISRTCQVKKLGSHERCMVTQPACARISRLCRDPAVIVCDWLPAWRVSQWLSASSLTHWQTAYSSCTWALWQHQMCEETQMITVLLKGDMQRFFTELMKK